jgi:HK97 family phage major capsid protein
LYSETVLRILGETSELFPLVTKTTMPGRLVRHPVESTAFALTYVATEVTAKTESIPTFTYIDQTARTYAGWVGVSDELMEDTFVDFARLFTTQAIEDLVDLNETQLLNTSSPSTGVLQAVGTASYIMAAGQATFDSVTWANLLSMQQEFTTRKLRRGSAYIMNPQIWDILCQEQDAMGRWYVDPVTAKPRTAWGYPIILSDSMPDLGDSNVSKKFIAFGNPARLIHGTRVGLEVRFFPETMYAVTQDESFFRIRTRLAHNVSIASAFCCLQTAAG